MAAAASSSVAVLEVDEFLQQAVAYAEQHDVGVVDDADHLALVENRRATEAEDFERAKYGSR